jgi:hypothetical protein
MARPRAGLTLKDVLALRDAVNGNGAAEAFHRSCKPAAKRATRRCRPGLCPPLRLGEPRMFDIANIKLVDDLKATIAGSDFRHP